MSKFKEQLETDIENVWFNNDEFSDWRTIDGKKMHILFDKHELIKRKNHIESGIKSKEGLYNDEMMIFVPCGEYGPKPRTGITILLDQKKRYRITNVDTQDGIYCFELEAVKVQ